MSRIKLGGIELAVTAMGFDVGQYVSWLKMPVGKSIAQDWGPELEGFRVRGWVASLSEKSRLQGLKDQRKPVVFVLDENSYQVQCGRFSFEEDMGNGELDYDLELTEVERPKTLVFVASAEMKAPRNMDTYLLLLRAEASAFWWLGITDRVAAWIQEMAVQAVVILDLMGDVIRLAELPSATLGQIRQAGAVVVTKAESLIDLVTEQLSEPRKYSESEEGLKRALVAARQIRIEMAALVTACDGLPKANTTAIVEDGDTLVTLAARWNRENGQDVAWYEIAAANGIEDPAEIEEGTEVVMPG